MNPHRLGSPSFTRRRSLCITIACLVAVGTVGTFNGRPAAAVPNNLLINPSFESSLLGWGSWGGRLARIADLHAPRGRFAAQATNAGGTRYTIESAFSKVPVTAAGEMFSASAFIAAGSTSALGKATRFVLRETDGGGAFVHTWTTPVLPMPATYSEVRVSGAATAAGDMMDVSVVQGQAAGGDAFRFDGAMLLAASAATPVPTTDPGSTSTPTLVPAPAPTLAPIATPNPSAPPAPAPPATAPPGFHLKFTDNFATDVPLGAFTDCNHNTDQPTAFCGGLAAYPAVSAAWWAYPAGWPDTATQRNLPVGGLYDPATVVSISGGQMHIRMWRGSSGTVHSATLVPRAGMNMMYGEYTETFRVSSVAPGYKSAHLLWPGGPCNGCEIDFPEDSWDTVISAFNHPKGGGNQDSFNNGTTWTGWHTSSIQWTPGDVKFILDGRLMGESTNGVMDSPAYWYIQNESSLDGESAAPNSSAQMDISSVSVYSYAP